MTAGGLVPSQTYKDLAARADNTAASSFDASDSRADIRVAGNSTVGIPVYVCMYGHHI